MNIYNMIESIANSRQSKNIAYVYEGVSSTYDELILQTNRFAKELNRNINKDDKVAILLGNSPEFIQAYLAVLKLGAIAIPLNPAFTEHELIYILNDANVKLVITKEDQQDKLLSVKSSCPICEHVIAIEQVDQQIISNDSYISPILSENDPAVILYTSGTTGNPKGAVITHRNIIENMNDFSSMIDLDESDKMIAVLPMFHSFCLTICVNMILLNGATTIIVPKFNPIELVDIIKKEKATLIAAVPTIYNYINQLSNVSSVDFTSLRACISGGSSIPIELLQLLQDKFKLNMLEGYGLSETSPVLTFNPYGGLCKPGSVGVDLPSVKTKILNEKGEEVLVGEIGEVVAKGPNVMMGYYNKIEETEKAFTNGWFKTGDLGKKDEDGYLFLLDRKKDVIITNGYNVYPREIEEQLYKHPNIIEAAVVGKPDLVVGEIVCAYLVVNQEIKEVEIKNFCQKYLIHYKVPKQIYFINELPKNSTGKILKRNLR
ncbi:long-chain-fatty-acid--CoA ligase [Gottfriedia solisilvae]|uniref:Long-chain-fatty-acid--CoA ligase n=1 Tax=Gottfriedia solisilvae TaxID=1516104 RepID=A0A8J3AIC6_9BACI|nr:long-chain fatty acid--CoA ligase [Gottfriedia solisilvae]GGI13359.1 long-chain-fatty-acid--CoA ligase [Gottfriedia solisilvae]